MTHELHAPLQTIVSQSDALARELGDANAAAAARHIKDASAELLALVRRADEVSRLAEGEVGSERRDVEIDAFRSDIAAALAPAAERSNNTLQIAIWSEIGVFPIDAENARRCLLCVCENAIEFTRGGVNQLGARRRGDWLEFTIEDTGARLSRDTQAQLHALLRGDVGDAGAHEALGLGLALSAGLARLMRAEISVSGADGRGALFTLRLPLAD
jgi:signal transduction histidine kinase